MKKLTEKEAFIQKSMTLLDITRDEAIELYQFDHDEIEVPEVEAIQAKIDANSVDKKRSSIEKVKYMKAKKKKDELKEAVISTMFDLVRDEPMFVLAQKMSTTKMSFMDANGSYYSITVTKNKTCPDGYTGIEKEDKASVL